MKYLLGIFVCLISLSASANDTLTTREIYDLNVGDTLIYRIYHLDEFFIPPVTYTQYEMKIITGKYVSPNSDTIIYSNSNTGQPDIYTNLDSFELPKHCIPDTSLGPGSDCAYYFGSLDTTGITTNTVQVSSLPYIANKYAKGLGQIGWYESGYNLGQYIHNKELVYFSKDTLRWGTFLTVINEPEREVAFALTPNPTTTQLNIAIDETLLGAQLCIYDVTGSVIKTELLSSLNYQIATDNFPSGVYIAEVKNKTGSVKRRWVKM